MKGKTWLILGATSIIAEEFAKLAAQKGYSLMLMARNAEQLGIIAADLRLRYQIDCKYRVIDFRTGLEKVLDFLHQNQEELALFIAYSVISENQDLNAQAIADLVQVNVLTTIQLIHAYLQRPQAEHRLIFLSSVAACRGRAKNSLYGGSKALIDTYLEGLQQTTNTNLHLTIARLGFIDTVQTFGLPGIFYASPPEACAKACWRASYASKRLIYHPLFWRFIMAIIKRLPFFLYKKMGSL